MTIKNFDIRLNILQFFATIDDKEYIFEITSYSSIDDTFQCTLWEWRGSSIIDRVEEFIIDSNGGTMDSISEISELMLKRAVFPDVYSSLKISEGEDD